MKHHHKETSGPMIETTGMSNIGHAMKANTPSTRGVHPSGGAHPFQQQSGHHDGTMDSMHSNHSDHADRVKKGHP